MPSKDFTYTQARVYALWRRARELEAEAANESEAASEPYRILANHFADEFMMNMKIDGFTIEDTVMDGIDMDEVLADVYAAYYDVDGLTYPEWPKDAPAQPSRDVEDKHEEVPV